MLVDVLIFGGGAAGLWCLDRFRRAGYVAVLLEANAIGCGQTIQAQGIIHGGGKYGLRGVRDFAAVRSMKEMPERWRRSLMGVNEPVLTNTAVLSDCCYLWLPRGSGLAWVQSWGFMSVVANAGLLSTPLRKVQQSDWPAALRGSATAVYSLAEPVISTGALVKEISQRYQRHISLYDPSSLHIANDRVETSAALFEPRFIVLAAGTGNAALLRSAGIAAELMQRRPLGMVLLKGDMPPLFAHCVVGGKTHLTITTPTQGIWQVGGEIAERLADKENTDLTRRLALSEIQRWLPGLSFFDVELAIYRAVRAEARTTDLRRPSGVHVTAVAPRIVVAWPTKLSLAPVLADEIYSLASVELEQPAGYDDAALPHWPPPLARYPWEDAEWFRAN